MLTIIMKMILRMFDHDHSLSGPSIINEDSHGTHTFSISGSKHLDVEELEMLLEAYFIQIEGTLNKLSTLREYVDDTRTTSTSCWMTSRTIYYKWGSC